MAYVQRFNLTSTPKLEITHVKLAWIDLIGSSEDVEVVIKLGKTCVTRSILISHLIYARKVHILTSERSIGNN